MATFGEMVAAKRREQGLTQGDLGRKVGLHWVTVSKLERGEMKMTEHLMKLFAQELRVPLSDLLPPAQQEEQDVEMSVTDELERLRAENEELKSAIDEKDFRIAELKHEVEELSRQIDAARRDNRTLSRAIRDEGGGLIG